MKKKALFNAKIIKCKRYQQKQELVIVIFLMYDAFKQSLEKARIFQKLENRVVG
ncbi:MULTISPECIES: hypothetical protein [unclassified Paenibacillus]|uniref:hypothetical protein n=1 Tax=unclassified Paenibacillus TaxID=185978 RepID=UPI000A4A4BDD|nr:MULTISPECIES: hypothetical protein [unclassified Paenibacillus]